MTHRFLAGAAATAALAYATLGAAGAAELRIGHSAMPNLGNPLCCTSNSQGYALQLAYDHMVYMDSEGAPQPGLFSEWKNINQTTWQVKLRPNVKFHNGKTLTADDIAGQLTYLLTDEGQAKAVAISRNVPALATAKAIDASTIEITTKTPDVVFIQQLGSLKGMDWKHFADVGYEGYATKPVGTGPYAPTNWQQDKIELVAFKEGWRPGKIDKVMMVALPELAARVSAFASNQIEVAMQINADSKKAIETAGGKFFTAPAPSNLTMMFMSTRQGSPVADVRVRKALNMGIDRQRYLDGIVGEGVTVATSQPAPKGVRGWQADIKPYPFDQAAAKKLLTEAGIPNGLKIVAEAVVNTSEQADIYQAVANDLSKMGVQMEIRSITLADLVSKARALKPVDGELVSFDMGAFPTIDMMRSINALHSCKGTTKWTCFPDIEPTITAANTEFDLKKRDEHLRKIAQYYHDMAPALFLHEQFQLDAVSNKVKGWKPVNWVINWHDLTM